MARALYLMHAVFLLAILFNLSSYFLLPDGVAIHFGRGGMPDSWLSKGSHVLISAGIFILLYAGFVISPHLPKGVQTKYINLPNANYWLLDENREEALRKLAGYMYSFGIATGLLLLISCILLVEANLSDPVKLEEGILLPSFGIYAVFTAGWLFRLITAFRIPKR